MGKMTCYAGEEIDGGPCKRCGATQRESCGRAVPMLEARIAALEAELSEAREKALEEAAKVCEKRAEVRFQENGFTEYDTNYSGYSGKREEEFYALDEEDEACAAAIRSRKVSP